MTQKKEKEIVSERGQLWYMIYWERIKNYRYSKYLSRLPTKFKDPELQKQFNLFQFEKIIDRSFFTFILFLSAILINLLTIFSAKNGVWRFLLSIASCFFFCTSVYAVVKLPRNITRTYLILTAAFLLQIILGTLYLLNQKNLQQRSVYHDSIKIENVLTYIHLVNILVLCPIHWITAFVSTPLYIIFSGLHLISYASVYEGELDYSILWETFQKYLYVAIITFVGSLMHQLSDAEFFIQIHLNSKQTRQIKKVFNQQTDGVILATKSSQKEQETNTNTARTPDEESQ